METYCLGFTAVQINRAMTRCGMLSVKSSVYDPLGLISPFVLPAKKLLQELTSMVVKWDEALPNAVRKSWLAWCEDQMKLADLSIKQ